MIINRNRPCLGLLFTLLLGLLCGVTPAQANDAVDLLNRMKSALRSLDYKGQLVYSRADELSTFRISHQAGASHESVVRLDTSESIPQGEIESFSLERFDQLVSEDEQTYTFDLGAETRVAGHPCRVLVARPKDSLRYLHRYCIHPDSGMLLKYSLMDRNQSVLEQLVFTQIAFEGRPGVTIEAKPLMQAQSIDTANVARLLLGNWYFDHLPKGFNVVNVIDQGYQQESASQIILSDGMTAVSIFITPEAMVTDIEEITYASGATHILAQELNDHIITFVGEVPLETLRKIQKGLRYVER